MRAIERVGDAYRASFSPHTRSQIAHARVRIRHVTNELRPLPRFLIIGAQRAGTSSLYRYLGAHPEVAAPLRKEVGYFTRFYDRGPGWYRAHFPLSRRAQPFEATPDYLLDPRAPARAAALLPDAKLVVLLRDPVERAWSHYQHMVRLGFEEMSFTDALAAEDERLGPDLERMKQDPLHDPKQFLRFSYVTRGQYAEQLERWFGHFPPDQVLVVPSESFYRDTAAVYADILRFIGVAPWAPASFRNHSGSAGKTAPLDPTIYEQLCAHFAPWEGKLTQLLAGHSTHAL